MSPVPTYLGKLRDVVKNEVVKKDMYDELVNNFNAIDTGELVKKEIIMLRSKILKIKYQVLLA